MVEMTHYGFDANQVPPSEDYDPLPEGVYRAEIINSEERPIGQHGEKGAKITFTWKITAGPCAERLVWQDILLGYNQTGEKADKTRDIAARQLSSICHAVGKLAPGNTEELHHIPCLLRIGFQKKQSPESPTRNEVKSVKPLEAEKAASPATATAPAPAASRQAGAERYAAASQSGGWARRQ